MKIDLRSNDIGDIFVLEGTTSPDILTVDDGQVSFGSDISYALRVTVSSELVIVTGTLKTIATFSCSRCLCDFEQEVINNEFEYIIKYTEGMCIDLTDEIREAIIIRLLVKPLCNEDCKGLCSVCGSDLNIGRCDCRKENKEEVLEENKEESAFGCLDFKDGKIDFK